jgi:hypothetical protein
VSDAPVTYVPRPDATPKDELSALAAVYRFLLDCHAKKGVATNEAASIGHKEEVSHVEQQPDRSSEITDPAAL